MVSQQIVSYIKDLIKKGYTKQQIKDYLINYNYNSEDINEAFSRLDKKKMPSSLMIIITGIFIGITIIIGAIFLIDTASPECPDSCDDNNRCTRDICSASTGYECSHRPIRPCCGNFECEHTETEVSCPQDCSLEIDSEKDECPDSCDDNNRCTKDICSASTGFICQHNVIENCCGNFECESSENYDNCPADCSPYLKPIVKKKTLSEVTEQARILAKDDPTEALEYCKEAVEYSSNCYSIIAEVTENSAYCHLIISDTKRDSCYTNFAVKGDYSVCEEITNKYLRESCNTLSQEI